MPIAVCAQLLFHRTAVHLAQLRALNYLAHMSMTRQRPDGVRHSLYGTMLEANPTL